MFISLIWLSDSQFFNIFPATLINLHHIYTLYCDSFVYYNKQRTLFIIYFVVELSKVFFIYLTKLKIVYIAAAQKMQSSVCTTQDKTQSIFVLFMYIEDYYTALQTSHSPQTSVSHWKFIINNIFFICEAASAVCLARSIQIKLCLYSNTHTKCIWMWLLWHTPRERDIYVCTVCT